MRGASYEIILQKEKTEAPPFFVEIIGGVPD